MREASFFRFGITADVVMRTPGITSTRQESGSSAIEAELCCLNEDSRVRRACGESRGQRIRLSLP